MNRASRCPFEPGVLPPESFLARYWARVDQTEGPDACWIWRGGRSRKSHGQYGLVREPAPGRRMLGAHRVALFLYTGIVGDGLDACHRDGCVSTLCVNPRHLYWGKHAENIGDNIRRYGRNARGHFLGRKDR